MQLTGQTHKAHVNKCKLKKKDVHEKNNFFTLIKLSLQKHLLPVTLSVVVVLCPVPTLLEAKHV